MKVQKELCNPRCQAFRCSQRALVFKGNSVWCKFADDACDVRNCKFTQCIRGKLISNGICGLTFVSKKVEIEPTDIEEPVRVTGKLAQKLKERELY